MYIKYAYYKGRLKKGDIVLMSASEFANGGNQLTGVPIAITPDGEDPVEREDIEPEFEPEQVPDPLDEIRKRLDKIEAIGAIKTELAKKETAR